MEEKTFNLLYEPWIKVLDREGKPDELSLLTVLEEAHEIRCLAGELPSQDVAILRLILAVLYATFTRADVYGQQNPIDKAEEAPKRWKSLWDLKRFPMEPIKKRLCFYEERFYLFHPERPFYQVAGLHGTEGKINTVSQIVSDVPSRASRRFISTKSGRDAEVLSFAEAARWLVSMQAWDYAGKKASVVGGSKDGGGTGWLGKIGVIYPAMNTLFETLLLNFVLLGGDKVLPYGVPTWEEEPVPGPQKKERRPAGYCELLTWQSRRIRLFAGSGNDKGLVNGVLYSYGDVFETADVLIEQMSGWHLSKLGKTKGHYIPNRHREERNLWRDLGSILPQADGSVENLSPGVVQWLAQIKERELMDEGIVQLCAVGFHYGPMNAKVDAMTSDTLSIHNGVFTELGGKWMPLINNLLKLTDNCVGKLAVLAADLAKAAGDSDSSHHRAGGGRADAGRGEAYFRMDEPFRRWLGSIDPLKTDMGEAEKEWTSVLKRILFQLGEEMSRQYGEKAIIGRLVEEKRGRHKVTNLYTAPGALAKFRRNVVRTIAKGGRGNGKTKK